MPWANTNEIGIRKGEHEMNIIAKPLTKILISICNKINLLHDWIFGISNIEIKANCKMFNSETEAKEWLDLWYKGEAIFE